MTHTPGKWTYHLSTSSRLAIVDSNRFYDDGNYQYRSICEIGKKYNPDFEADARLIAAAPTLLEACKMAVDVFRKLDIDILGVAENGEGMRWPIRDEIIDGICKAIAKAEVSDE